MITKLTKYQEKKMYEYRDEGIRIAKDITPIDHKKLERTVRDLYAECGLSNDLNFKYFDFFDIAYSKVINENSIENSIWNSIRNSIWNSIENSIRNSIENSIRNSIWWGQYNIDWIQYHAYYNDIIGFKAKNEKLLKILIELSKNSHILFLFEKTVCVVEKPISIMMEGNSLHSFDDFAVKYKNGKGFYLSHGVIMSKKYITTPADKISVQTILKEENSEIRRELLRKVGIDNFIKKSKAKPIDKSEDGIYELYKVQLGKDKTGMYLKMKNPSIDTYHFEGVIDSCDTVEKALAWRDSEEEYIKPIILT